MVKPLQKQTKKVVSEIPLDLNQDPELQESESLYRGLFDHMLDGFALCEMIYAAGKPIDFTYLRVNPEFERLTGLKDVIGKKVTAVIPGIRETNPDIFEIYGRVAQTGIAEKFETYLSVLQIWFSVSVYSPQKNYFVAIFENINERKTAETALRSSEERFRTLSETLSDVIFEWDLHETIDWLGGIDEMLGYPSGEYPRTLDGWRSTIHPDDIKKVDRIRVEAMVGKKPFQVEYRIQHKDGTWRLCQTRGVIVKDLQNHSARMVGSLTDITAQKEIETELVRQASITNTLINSPRDFVLFLDPEGTILNINQLGAKVFGLSKEELVGQNIYTFLPESERTERRKIIAEVMRTDIPAQVEDIRGDEHILNRIYVTRDPISQELIGTAVFAEDISERKKKEEEIRQSEVRFSTIFSSSPIAMLIRELDSGLILDANAAYFKLVEGDREQIIGTKVDGLILKMNSQALHKFEKEICIAGKVSNQEVNFQTLKGNNRTMLVSYEPIEINRVQCLLASALDITASKQNEQAIKNQEDLLQMTGEMAKIGGWEFDPNTLKGTWTKEVAKIHELDPDLETDVNLGVSFYPGEERKKIDKAIKDAIEKNLPYDLSLEMVTAKGNHKWVRTMGLPIKENDRVVKVQGIFQDITEQKKALEAVEASEEKFRTLFEKSPIGLSLADKDCRFIDANNSFCELLGYSKEEIVHKTVADITYEEDKQNFIHNSEAVLSGASHGYSTEKRYIKKDGSLIWVEVTTAPIVDKNGNFVYGLGMVNDITERKQADEKLTTQLHRVSALRSIDTAIASSFNLQVILQVLLENVTQELGVDAASVLLLNQNLNVFNYGGGRGFSGNYFSRFNLRMGEEYAGKAALERNIIHIPDLNLVDYPAKMRELIQGEGFVSFIAVPLIAKGRANGVLQIFHRSPLNPDPEWMDFLETLAGQTAIAIDNTHLFNDLQQSNIELTMAYDATIEGWSAAMDLRDKETEGHTQRVTYLSLRLARLLGVSDSELIHIRRGTLLHDIGKMGVPDSILHKPGPLTDEEWVIMRKHPQFAYDLISSIKFLRPAADIPFCHHEKWDGSGYPRGLMKDQIPLAARLFTVVDVWDAITNERPYRKAWSREEALEYMRTQAGKHFDPNVVNTFLEMILNETN